MDVSGIVINAASSRIVQKAEFRSGQGSSKTTLSVMPETSACCDGWVGT